MEQEVNNRKELQALSRKIEILVAGRLRKKDAIDKAVATQNNLSKKSGQWSGAEEIKKWRQEKKS